jgi:disulfide bond formation protein DsbB
MLTAIPPRTAHWIIFAVMLATIVGAWVFETMGYQPCDLCLQQRWAYYVIVPFSFAMAAWNPDWSRKALWLSFLILCASTVFGTYHAGVEYKWWPGPDTCGAGSLGDGLPDLTKPVVKCDEPALMILGMSLAGWNATISSCMAYVAYLGTRLVDDYGSSSESQ